MVLFFNSILVFAASVGVDLSAVDTIYGEDTFYSFEEVGQNDLNEGTYLLALRKPDMSLIKIRDIEFKDIDYLKPYRIDSEDLNVVGSYDLFLLEQGDTYSNVILRDGFRVVKSISDVSESEFNLSSWFQGNLFGIGGDEILLAQAEMNRFDIEDLPVVVEVQSPITFTLQALDEAQEDDLSYNGTVRIEVLNDPNAITPNDYTFVLQDAGEHRFVNSLVFNSVGTKTLKITDVDDEDITAEFNVEVIDSDQVEDEGTLLQIESPVSTIYTENRLLVQGNTEPGLEIVVLEGGAEFTRFDAEVDGSFTELLPPIEDGTYTFQFQVNETLSSPIQVEIRTGGIGVRSLDLSSESVSPLELISVELELTSTANSASIILNGIKTDLFKQDVTGTFFTGQVTGPSTSGQYPLNIMIVDELGNTETVENASVITVSGNISDDESTNDPVVSGQILGLIAEGQDKRVRLSWNAPSGVDVIFYTIKFGLSPDALSSMVDTTSSTTEWFVPNLQNDVPYYFQVFAVNTLGDEVAGSGVIQASPGRPDVTGLMVDSDVTETSDTGPGLIAVLLISLCLSWYWRVRTS